MKNDSKEFKETDVYYSCKKNLFSILQIDYIHFFKNGRKRIKINFKNFKENQEIPKILQ